MSIRWDTRNKRWRYEFDRYVEGVRHRSSRLLPRGWSQAQADAYERAESGRLYAVATGIQQAAEPLIEQAVAAYLEDKRHLKSWRSAAEHLAAIAWAYVGRPMSALPEVAREVAQHRAGAREGTEVGPGSVRNRLALLKAACRHAWKVRGLVPHDPTGRMMLPPAPPGRQVYATRAEVGALARAADRRDLRVVILLAWYTGARLGEILHGNGVAGCLVPTSTKNGRPKMVPVPPHAQHLLAHLPMSTPTITIQRAWQRARARAGLDHLHLHDLRHAAASEMINAGHDLYTVGRVLGHVDQRSTQRYAHLQLERLAEATASIGRKSPHKAGAPKRKTAA